MLKIGITGGIGSGKSTVCKIFSILGVPVYHADSRAKILIDEVPDIKAAIVEEFGTESFTHDTYNLKYMSELVFGRKEYLHKLNSIIHPYVQKDFVEWSSQHENSKYILEEAAILFESGANKNLDYVIVMDAPLKDRMKRISERDHLSEEMILKRIENQWPADKILGLADWIIRNDDKHLILPQILSIHDQLIT